MNETSDEDKQTQTNKLIPEQLWTLLLSQSTPVSERADRSDDVIRWRRRPAC